MTSTNADNRNHQDRFLRNVRKALGFPTETKRSAPDLFRSERASVASERYKAAKLRTRQARLELLDRLIERAEPLNLKVIPLNDINAVSSAIAKLVAEKDPEWGTKKCVAAWRHPLIDSLNLSGILAEQNVPIYITDLDGHESATGEVEERRIKIRRQIMESYIGVTSADFCLAETATLVLRTRPNHARAVSLVPSIHVAVIELDQILSDLGELYAFLQCDPAQQEERLTNCMTLISGPSKTADIELVMVHGAHGPREVYIYVVC
jgi:L-lactate dehydrogenase complex protein LldG